MGLIDARFSHCRQIRKDMMNRALVFLVLCLCSLSVSNALPSPLYNESTICAGGHCDNRTGAFKYERRLDVQPGYQWDDAGG